MTSLNNAIAYQGGFKEPVFESQTIFRSIMKAMAEPGLLISCKTKALSPKPLLPLAGAALLTLCDGDTPFYLENGSANETLIDWLKFQTALPLATSSSQAAFVLIEKIEDLPVLENFAVGTDEYPDRSATLIVQVSGFERGDELTLEGPGIKEKRSFFLENLPDHFFMSWQRNRGLFPRGVDILFVSSEGFVGLPRSTKVVKGEADVCRS